MSTTPKYVQISRLLSERIASGVYTLSALPGERKLAEEFGVSHMTARKAVQSLIQNGLLRRTKGICKRPPAPSKRECAGPHVALLAPAYDSMSRQTWHYALEKESAAVGGSVQAIPYININEPVVIDALNNSAFDGIFLFIGGDLSSLVLSRLVRAKKRLFTLCHDLTESGIPNIDTSRPSFCRRLVDYLAVCGYENVSIVNVHPETPTITNRIKACEAAARGRGLAFKTYSDPVKPFGYLEYKARELVLGLYKKSKPTPATALILVSAEPALGVYRAFHELGVRICDDVGVCACDNPRQAKILAPSLTILDTPPPDRYLRRALQLLKNGNKRDNRQLDIRPSSIDICQGESTKRQARK